MDRIRHQSATYKIGWQRSRDVEWRHREIAAAAQFIGQRGGGSRSPTDRKKLGFILIRYGRCDRIKSADVRAIHVIPIPAERAAENVLRGEVVVELADYAVAAIVSSGVERIARGVQAVARRRAVSHRRDLGEKSS